MLSRPDDTAYQDCWFCCLSVGYWTILASGSWLLDSVSRCFLAGYQGRSPCLVINQWFCSFIGRNSPIWYTWGAAWDSYERLSPVYWLLRIPGFHLEHLKNVPCAQGRSLPLRWTAMARALKTSARVSPAKTYGGTTLFPRRTRFIQLYRGKILPKPALPPTPAFDFMRPRTGSIFQARRENR